MKKLVLMMVIALLSMGASAQQVYFPSQEGMILEYADKNAKGKVTGYTIYQIKKVDNQSDDTFTVAYLVSILDAKRKEVMTGMDVTVKVVNGTVYFDGSSLMGQLAENLTIEGNGLTIPNDISAGQQLEDFSVSIDAISTRNTCTDVMVAAEEQLTTDAGTFDTYRIDMKFAGKALFIKTEGSMSQWYAKGIGEVKSINYNKKGQVTTSRELVKVTK